MADMGYRGIAYLMMAGGCGYAQTVAPAAANIVDLKAQVFRPKQGAVRIMANGGQSRAILHAALATGEAVSIHESIQLPGAMPNPPHAIEHSEFMLVREGTLAFEHDGLSEKAEPGSIIYVAYGTMHTVRNIGTTTAKYTVIAIGGDQK